MAQHGIDQGTIELTFGTLRMVSYGGIVEYIAKHYSSGSRERTFGDLATAINYLHAQERECAGWCCAAHRRVAA